MFKAQANEFTKQRAVSQQPDAFMQSTPIAHADTSSYQKSSPNISYDAGDAVGPAYFVQQQQTQMHTNFHVPALERNVSEFDDMESDMMDDLIDFLVEGNSGAISNATSSSTVFSAPLLNSFDYNPFAPLQTTPPNYGATMRTLPQEHTPTATSIPQDNFNQTSYPGVLSMYHPNSTPPHASGHQPMQPRSAEKSVHNNSTLLSSTNGAGQSTYQLQHHNSFSQPRATLNVPASFQFSHTAPTQTLSATAAPAQVPTVTMPPMLVISDFSPAQDHQQGGGTKVLVCLANDIPEGFRQHSINICFGDYRSRFFVSARAELVTPTVLRCKTPSNGVPGSCQLWVEDEQNELRSEPAEQLFEFISPVSISNASTSRSNPVSGLGKRPSSRDSELRVHTNTINNLQNNHMGQPMQASPHGYRLPAHFANSILRRSSPLRGGDVSMNSSSDFDKEHKIRIVEKLGTMKYALTHEDTSPNSASLFSPLAHDEHAPGVASHAVRGLTRSHSHSQLTDGADAPSNTHADSVKWLDDQELSELSTEELEVLMDRYIMVVVKQLVQLAVMDDDLKAEIDSLDASGFSLLHYCCLYNLNSLIPVLLARGADVNRRTSTGSTALHLAAAAGHLAVTQVLVESGAVVTSYDANNVLPSDAAYEAGYIDIFNLLLALENREMVCTDTTPSSAEEMTSEMMDANHALRYGSSPIAKHNHAYLPAPPLPSALGPLSFSPVATNKHRMEVPTLKFDSPPPAFPGEMALDASNLSVDGSSALSNKLLHEAFASLSLTDKCALTLSMGQLNADGSKKLVPGSSATSNVPSATGTPRALSKSANLNLLGTSLDSSLLTASVTGEEISEMQSVLSETDQESLHKAMAMMRHSELEQVEAEVRTIQNNWRAWMLRKNYTNLREAARVLQGAWREKKKNASGPPTSARTGSPPDLHSMHAHSAARGHHTHLSTDSGSSIDLTGPNSGGSGTSSSGDGNNNSLKSGPNRAQLQAAATLQAATRGMLARRSFSSVRKQTMASLVIQKSLVKWWEQNKVAGGGPHPAPPAPKHSY
eukprot:gene14775-16944_t